MSALRVGVLGWGAIGSAVGERLMAGAVPGARLAAIATRSSLADAPAPVVGASELPDRCDVVVEAAGHDGVREHVANLLGAGCRVIIVSTGALRDRELFNAVTQIGGPRLSITSGAVGGLDIITACRHAGEIESIRLTTTKPPHTLVQPWMDDDMVAALEAGERVVECFSGSADDAAGRFPASVNVAATLAVTAGSWDLIEVTVIGDPAATGNRHVIEISADAGEYRVELANRALPSNPRSSALVVASVLSDLAAILATGWCVGQPPGVTWPDS